MANAAISRKGPIRRLIGVAALCLAWFSAGFLMANKIRPEWIGAGIWLTGNAAGCSLEGSTNEIHPLLQRLAAQLEGESFVRESTPDGLQHWVTPAGNFWSPRGNALFFDLAEQSADLYEAANAGIRHGDIVLDCGANVGTFTRTALLAGASKVVAFDIDPRNLECLRRTFAPEIRDGRVMVVEKGVWNAEATMKAKFYTNTNLNTITMAGRVESSEKPVEKEVPLTAIDTAVRELGLPRVDFIKMDVEGAERKALEGAIATIRAYRPRLSIATENEPEDVHAIPEWVNRLGLDYKTQLGSCRQIRPWMIRPEVAMFAPAGR